MFIKKMHQKDGFTLLELLWVIVIIGFITAMVAPRLGGVSQRSAEKINNANLKDMKKYVEAYQQENAGDFPGKMINPVLAGDDGITNAGLASVENRTNDVPESIASDFSTRCLLTAHVLNDAEATELQDMGISTVLSWNHPDDPAYAYGTHWNRYDAVDVESGVVVAMIGGGSEDDSSSITANARYDALGENIGRPEWLYRIVAGIGPDSDLVTGGTLESAPLCPAGINSNHYLYNYYSLVLPRLTATVSRIASGSPFDDDDGDGNMDFDVIDAANAGATDGGQIKRIQLEAMTAAEFDSVDATGHGRQEDVLLWQLYDNGDGL